MATKADISGKLIMAMTGSFAMTAMTPHKITVGLATITGLLAIALKLLLFLIIAAWIVKADAMVEEFKQEQEPTIEDIPGEWVKGEEVIGASIRVEEVKRNLRNVIPDDDLERMETELDEASRCLSPLSKVIEEEESKEDGLSASVKRVLRIDF